MGGTLLLSPLAYPSLTAGWPTVCLRRSATGPQRRLRRRTWLRGATLRLPTFGCFPAEAGERGVAAEEADSDGHAPVRRNDHAIQSELADQAKQKASCQINDQRAVGKRAADAQLHEALQAVPRQRADGAKNRNQR